MITIHFQNRQIILSENAQTTHDFSSEKITDFLNNSDIKQIKFNFKDIHEGFQRLKSHFKYIEAAGGLVYNQKKELLVIERFGLPDLPKGKIEKGESVDKAALREVKEECGIKNLILGKALDSSYHIYPHKNKFALKRTHWFEMQHLKNERLKPQTEESITAVFWCDAQRCKTLAEQTYSNLRPYFLHKPQLSK